MAFYREKDIENYVYSHPGKITTWGYVVEKWIARQFRVPSGIIDLLGYAKTTYLEQPTYFPLVLEIKNHPIKSKDLAQVCRYAQDIDDVMSIRDFTFESGTTIKVILGVGDIDKYLLHEANALNVNLKTISYIPQIDFGGTWKFVREYSEQLREEIRQVSFSSVFDVFGKNDTKDLEEYLDQKQKANAKSRVE